MFIAKATKRELVEIYVSNVLHGFLNFERTRLPTEAVTSKTFTVMDTSEETVFLHIQNHGPETPLGDIFVSDGAGKFYSMSIENVVRGQELVDFEKVNSLEGVFIANKFEDDTSRAQKSIMGKPSTKGGKEFTQADIEAQTFQQSKMSQGNNRNINKKQKQTQESVKKESQGEDQKIQSMIKSYITHNKGGKWELIKAPTIDSEGKKINCYLDEGCSLHLQIYSSDGLYAPPYS